MPTTSPTPDHQRCSHCGTWYHADEVKWHEDADGDPLDEYCYEAIIEWEKEAQQESDIDWLTDTAMEADNTVGGKT